MSRYLGLDIGDKTVGVAVSDPLFVTAQGVTTIERVGIRKDTTKVVEYVKEYDASLVVAGLPLMLSGEDSPQTAKVREFVTLLENKLYGTDPEGASEGTAPTLPTPDELLELLA